MIYYNISYIKPLLNEDYLRKELWIINKQKRSKMKFKAYINEKEEKEIEEIEKAEKAGTEDKKESGFDQTKLKSKALKWLKAKWTDSYDFIHKPNLTDGDKTFHVSQDGEQFSIVGRRYDSNGDGEKNSVAFKIVPAETEIPKNDQDEW